MRSTFEYLFPTHSGVGDLVAFLGLPLHKNFSKLSLEIDVDVPGFVKLKATKFNEISGGDEIEYTDEEYYLKYNKATGEFISVLI